MIENPAWKIDHITISEMHISNISQTVTYESMFNMVAYGRADFALFEFGFDEDMSLTRNGFTLHIVPGFKVSMLSSRHYVVSKTHPDGEEFFTALQKGIEILKSQNSFKIAFTEVGFLNQKVEDWKIINYDSNIAPLP